MSVSNSLSGGDWELDEVSAMGDPTHMAQIGSGLRVSTDEVAGVCPFNDAWQHAALS